MSDTTNSNQPQAATAAKTSAEETVQAIGKVESKTRSRMRVRLKKELRTPEAMAQIEEQLNNHEDVSDVSINQRTGSVVFTHGKHRDSHHVLHEAINETRLIVGTIFDLPEPEEEGGGDRFDKLDQQVAQLLYKADYWLWQKTKIQLRGQVLVGAIAGLGITQIAIYGIGLELLPGPLLLWIAWDIRSRIRKEPSYQERFAKTAAQPDSPEPGAETALPSAA